MDPRSSIWKNRSAGGVLAVSVLLLTVIVNLPYRYIERGGGWIGHLEFGDNESNRHVIELPTMAGWPLCYWVQYEFEGQKEDRFWSTTNLVANLLIAIAVAVLVFVFTQMRHRAIESAGNRRLIPKLFDVSVAVLIVLVPLTILAQAYRTKVQHQRLIRQAYQCGNCFVSCWLPEPVAKALPAGLADVLLRVRQVELFRPDDHLLAELATVKTLTGIHVAGRRLDAASLDAFAPLVHLVSVDVTSCDVDHPLVESISRFPWLQQVRLLNTSIDSEMLHRLDSMQRLRFVDLRGTQMQISQLGKPNWSSTVETLALARLADGVDATLTIDNWPKLRSLVIFRSSLRLSDSTITLRLSHLPNLESLSIDRVQKHALIGHDLPRLTTINEDLSFLYFALGERDHVPGLTWLSELHLDGVASLTRIGCFARDLNSLSIRNAPNLRELQLGSYQVCAGGTALLETVDPGSCQNWIDELGRGDGPVMVDLTALPLSGIDLSPLVANARIRNLRLANTKVSFQQIKALSEMKQLESLDLNDCPLEQGQLAWLLEHHPKLAELHIDGSMLQEVDLTGTNPLRVLRTTNFKQLRDLRMVDVPDLDVRLHLVGAPDRIVIRNAPSLRGIAVEQPWPKDAEVCGLRDLEWFSAGGAELNDSVVDALLSCEAMDRLTLAYSSISPEKLSRLGELSELSSLSVPGLPVDDQVTAHWHGLTKLQRVNLDDCSISLGTLAWLSQIDPLRRLSINRVNLNDAAAAVIANLVQLTDLQIADTSMNPNPLIALLSRDTLERLDLSGWQLDGELVDALANCLSLQWLTIHHCELSNESLQKIVATNPKLKIDLGEQTQGYSASLVANLETRIIEQARYSSPSWYSQIISTVDYSYAVVGSGREASDSPNRRTGSRRQRILGDQPGTIDPEPFRQTRLAAGVRTP